MRVWVWGRGGGVRGGWSGGGGWCVGAVWGGGGGGGGPTPPFAPGTTRKSTIGLVLAWGR